MMFDVVRIASFVSFSVVVAATAAAVLDASCVDETTAIPFSLFLASFPISLPQQKYQSNKLNFSVAILTNCLLCLLQCVIYHHQTARLYRKALKTLSSWVIDRNIFIDEATALRSRFDENRGCDTAKAVRLLRVSGKKKTTLILILQL